MSEDNRSRRRRGGSRRGRGAKSPYAPAVPVSLTSVSTSREAYAETRRWLQGMIAFDPAQTDDFVVEPDGRAIGKAGCWRLGEIGFILHPDHWGQGLAREALEAVIPHVFATLPVDRLGHGQRHLEWEFLYHPEIDKTELSKATVLQTYDRRGSYLSSAGGIDLGFGAVQHLDQQAAIALFESLGFKAEALLRDHVRDVDGKTHDIVVLGHNIAQVQAQMEAYGLPGAVQH